MKQNTPTPHNAAAYGEIAPTVIMAGDPLRVKFIAENYLENPKLYNEVRGMLGYTGYYKGKRVSVQGHGMGIPSIGIYSYELFNFYDVERIIRVGTCGALDKDTKLGSVILAQAACSDSNYGGTLGIDRHFSPCADFQLLRKAAETAERMGIDYRAGNVMSSDAFYASATETDWAKLGVLGVEMEAYGLYINAAMAGKKALTILSVSDNVVTGEELSPEQRQTGLRNMIELALEL